MTKLSISKILVAGLAALAMLVTFVASFHASHASDDLEMPTWQGVKKMEAHKEADRIFIQESIELGDGNVDIAANRGIQLGWKAIEAGDTE